MNISQSHNSARQILGIETAPHLKGSLTTQKIMGLVLLSLIPAFIVDIYFFGYGVFWQFIISSVTAVICETTVALLRHRKPIIYISDMSYLVTSAILALTLPPLLPCYFTVVATVFAIIVVKAVFGGLGQNIFNPAMAGFIFIVISCPSQMYSTWIVPAPAAVTVATAEATFDVIFNNVDPLVLKKEMNKAFEKDYSPKKHKKNNDVDVMTEATELDDSQKVDTFTGATYLEVIKSARKRGALNEETPDHDFSESSYQAYLMLAIAYLFGGLILMCFRIIMIKMVITYFAAFIALTSLMNYLLPGNFMNVQDSLLFGGTMLAAFYIVTDPVTNAGTSRGRVIYTLLVVFLIVFIRAFGSYSDAVAFAVMISNAFAPLIDVLTKRRSFGHGYRIGE